MASTKTINTRLQLKYDSYENWTTNNPVLLQGEVAIAYLGENKDGVVNAPATLIKVGSDGETHYNDLQFLSAKAADVNAWAKKTEDEFKTWVAEIISTEGAYDSKGSAEQALKDAKDYTDEVAATKADKSEVISLYDASKTYAEGDMVHVVDDDSRGIYTYFALKESTGVDPFEDGEAWQLIFSGHAAFADYSNFSLEASSATYAQYASEKDETNDETIGSKFDRSILKYDPSKSYSEGSMVYVVDESAHIHIFTSMNGDAPAESLTIGNDGEYASNNYWNENQIGSAFEAFLAQGTIYNKETGEEERHEYVFVDTFNDIFKQLESHSGAIETLNGTGEGSVDKKINDAFNDFATKVSDDAVVNTYKELIDYAAEHGSEFTELVGKVTANTEAIEAIDNHSHTNKAVLDGITSDKVTAWDAAEQNAKDYADSLASNYATAEQGGKADTALQEITTTENGGLKVTNKNQIDIDDNIVFILDCGDSTITE